MGDTVRQYWRELVSILLGFAFLVASEFTGGTVLLSVPAACFVGGGLVRVALRYGGTRFRVYAATVILQFWIPCLLWVAVGTANSDATLLAMGAFFFAIGGILLISFATDVETRRLNPVLFLIFAAILLLLEQLLAALLLVGLGLFAAYRAFGSASPTA